MTEEERIKQLMNVITVSKTKMAKINEEYQKVKEELEKAQTELNQIKQTNTETANKNDKVLTEAEKEANELLAQIEVLEKSMNIK
ncbi:MAG: hypothetical protein MRERV_16c007 [Mycoplasmataceae bacterium RV_VA103A]|nr:MAG: hypothetical protein MRERV_16c007 [Mycoplasmataceae bacterium RV_VA103A]